MAKKTVNQSIKDNKISDASLENEVVFKLTRGRETVELLFDYENETIWATQNTIAELFDTTKQNISKHIINIISEGELTESATVNEKLTVQNEGGREVSRKLAFYSLDMIIAVGYRVNSEVATRFRKWATARLNEFLIKGFTMDDNRLKKYGSRYFEELLARVRDIRNSERNLYQKVTDIYATAIDYDSRLESTRDFFATVQNKMHFAVTGSTAAEIINERVDSSLPNMGLTSFKGRYIIQNDIAIAKNYLSEEELMSLNRLVDAYLSFAEIQAARKNPMTMIQWQKKIDEYLKFASFEILDNMGSISHEQAIEKAESEFEKYRVMQDRIYESDFDKEMKKILDKNNQ